MQRIQPQTAASLFVVAEGTRLKRLSPRNDVNANLFGVVRLFVKIVRSSREIMCVIKFR